jgi:hypothetical protein
MAVGVEFFGVDGDPHAVPVLQLKPAAGGGAGERVEGVGQFLALNVKMRGLDRTCVRGLICSCPWIACLSAVQSRAIW